MTGRGLQRLGAAASQACLAGILEEEACVHSPGSNHVPCAQESAPAERHRGGARPAAMPRVGTDAFGQSGLDVSGTANAEGFRRLAALVVGVGCVGGLTGSQGISSSIAAATVHGGECAALASGASVMAAADGVVQGAPARQSAAFHSR